MPPKRVDIPNPLWLRTLRENKEGGGSAVYPIFARLNFVELPGFSACLLNSGRPYTEDSLRNLFVVWSVLSSGTLKFAGDVRLRVAEAYCE